MKTLSRTLAAWMIAISVGNIGIVAQTAPPTTQPGSGTPGTAPDMQPVNDALKFRSDLVAGVAGGTEATEDAIVRLRGATAASGLQVDPDADFALAASDIGRRLVVAGKTVEAERFFQEAEKSLTSMILKTPDRAAVAKTQYLSTRATLRARYLNEAAAAKADIDAALQLQPDSAYLKQLRIVLGGGRGEIFNAAQKN